MKTILTLSTSLVLAVATLAADPPTNPAPAEATLRINAAAATITNAAVTVAITNNPITASLIGTPLDDSPGTNGNGSQLLRMNFRGASLEMVLNYMSEAAGFIINVKPGTSIRGKVDAWSNDPVT
ncbi:MAG TPA: hypothetical protein VN794_08375, partial [Methylomirabilota bacterium]|nr:hypothetical protein [Methylomirabilota bacterium]